MPSRFLGLPIRMPRAQRDSIGACRA